MQLSATLLFTAFASLVAAQNPFSFVTLPASIKTGEPFEITWSPSTGTVDTVTLILRQGDPDHLATVITIAAGIENTGSYIWTPPSTLTKGDEYAFEIQSDGNKDIVNYSGQFAIDSPNTISSALPPSTSKASGSASGLPAVTTTGSESSGTTTADQTESSGSAQSEETGTSSRASRTTGGSSPTQGSGTSAPSATDNGAAVMGVKVSGGLLALVGAVMAAL